MSDINISVIICTFNGARKLEKTLSYLIGQHVSENVSWELILADNNSTDDTVSYCKAFWNQMQSGNVPLITLHEAKRGKLYALQRAIKAARGEYIVLCDDDNWLSSDYLQKAYELLTKMPKVAALGGFGIAAADCLPAWFADYQFGYAVGPQAKNTGYLDKTAFLWGAGMAFRKALYLEMYDSIPSLLPEYKEANILSAEDTEFSLRLQLKGYSLYYDASLVYHHEITPERLTPDYRAKLFKSFIDAHAVLGLYHAALTAQTKTSGKPHYWLFLWLKSVFNSSFATKEARRRKYSYTMQFLFPNRTSNDPWVETVKSFMRAS